MNGVPAAIPVTLPERDPTVPSAVLLLLHVPPGVPSLNVVERPVQTAVTPDIGAGVGLTVTGAITKQPVGTVYVMLGMPVATPVTTPVPEPTVAKAGLLLLHTPPAGVLLRLTEDVVHTLVVPVIAEGVALIVAVIVVKQPDGSA